MAVESQVDRGALKAFVEALRHSVTRPGRLFLIGETSQLAEGWRDRAPYLLLSANDDDAGGEPVRGTVQAVADRLGVAVVWEAPAHVVPLPGGADRRHRQTDHSWPVDQGTFEILHYDPYSVICRGIARGDEPDYQTALRYVERGWVTEGRLIELFEELIPQLSAATIAQDPAEFRRKLKGLLQMWRARANRSC